MNVHQVIKKCAEQNGVAFIVVRFSGGGDSGGYDYVEFYSDKWKEVASIDEEVEGEFIERSARFINGEVVSSVERKVVRESLPKFIERVADQDIMSYDVDWWNNEGGSGTWTFDVKKCRATTEINVMVSTCEVFDERYFGDEDDGVGQLCQSEEAGVVQG